jgi:hypothetical protein
MKLENKSQPLTAFTFPKRGQFHWITSPLGLLGCPARFQRLMEQVLRGLQNVLIYNHTDTHEWHLEVLEQVLLRRHRKHLKINLDKCLFGNQQVSYLGFTLTRQVLIASSGLMPCKGTYRCQIHLVLCRTVHFFLEPYSELCNYSSPTVQADPSRLRIPLRSLTKGSRESIPGTPDAIKPRTNLGFSPSWPRIPPNHKCIYSHQGSSRRTLCNLGTEEQLRTDPDHFA